MIKHIYIIGLILLIACGSEIEFQEIFINKTVKVYSNDYHDNADNYTFKWEPPIGPTDKVVPFDLKNDMLIFTPKAEGNYEIHLSITDISDIIIARETFYYKAITDTIESNIFDDKKLVYGTDVSSKIKKPTEKSKNKQNQKKKTNSKKSKKHKKKVSKEISNNNSYTIQIAAWPSLEEARDQQLGLINEDIDAYIERYYRSKQDDVLYRVRVGNFKNKTDAISFQKQIESIIQSSTWIDILQSK